MSIYERVNTIIKIVRDPLVSEEKLIEYIWDPALVVRVNVMKVLSLRTLHNEELVITNILMRIQDKSSSVKTMGNITERILLIALLGTLHSKQAKYEYDKLIETLDSEDKDELTWVLKSNPFISNN